MICIRIYYIDNNSFMCNETVDTFIKNLKINKYTYLISKIVKNTRKRTLSEDIIFTYNAELWRIAQLYIFAPRSLS